MMYVRLVHLLDKEKRKELMIIYGEDVAPTGYTVDELRKGGTAFEKWAAIEKALITRATQRIMIGK